MSSNRAMDLFQKLSKIENEQEKLDTERTAVRNELGQLLGFVKTEETAEPAKKPVQKAAPAQKPPRQRTVKVGENGSKSQPSLKEVVKTILGKYPEGLELRAIVTEVTGMIERQEYISNAKSVTAVVSQAINQLQADKLIVGEKSADSKRNRYILAPAA